MTSKLRRLKSWIKSMVRAVSSADFGFAMGLIPLPLWILKQIIERLQKTNVRGVVCRLLHKRHPLSHGR